MCLRPSWMWAEGIVAISELDSRRNHMNIFQLLVLLQGESHNPVHWKPQREASTTYWNSISNLSQTHPSPTELNQIPSNLWICEWENEVILQITELGRWNVSQQHCSHILMTKAYCGGGNVHSSLFLPQFRLLFHIPGLFENMANFFHLC